MPGSESASIAPQKQVLQDQFKLHKSYAAPKKMTATGILVAGAVEYYWRAIACQAISRHIASTFKLSNLDADQRSMIAALKMMTAAGMLLADAVEGCWRTITCQDGIPLGH